MWKIAIKEVYFHVCALIQFQKCLWVAESLEEMQLIMQNALIVVVVALY